MHKLYELKEKLMDELEAYTDNGKYSKEDVEAIKYMASAVDHLCNIMEGAEEYSNAMGRSYARGGRRGRGANQYGSYAQRRDTVGRYSRDGRMMNTAAGYSMAGDIAEELKDLMQDAPDSQTRQEIQHIVSRLEQM